LKGNARAFVVPRPSFPFFFLALVSFPICALELFRT
jgi:hypothetical protein